MKEYIKTMFSPEEAICQESCLAVPGEDSDEKRKERNDIKIYYKTNEWMK